MALGWPWRGPHKRISCQGQIIIERKRAGRAYILHCKGHTLGLAIQMPISQNAVTCVRFPGPGNTTYHQSQQWLLSLSPPGQIWIESLVLGFRSNPVPATASMLRISQELGHKCPGQSASEYWGWVHVHELGAHMWTPEAEVSELGISNQRTGQRGEDTLNDMLNGKTRSFNRRASNAHFMKHARWIYSMNAILGNHSQAVTAEW